MFFFLAIALNGLRLQNVSFLLSMGSIILLAAMLLVGGGGSWYWDSLCLEVYRYMLVLTTHNC